MLSFREGVAKRILAVSACAKKVVADAHRSFFPVAMWLIAAGTRFGVSAICVRFVLTIEKGAAGN